MNYENFTMLGGLVGQAVQIVIVLAAAGLL